MNDEIEQVDISNLLLDPENPRLPESVGRDQIAMLDYIAETTADTFLLKHGLGFQFMAWRQQWQPVVRALRVPNTHVHKICFYRHMITVCRFDRHVSKIRRNFAD